MDDRENKQDFYKDAIGEALSVLPARMSEELLMLMRTRRGALSEIRLRAQRLSSAVIGGENVPLHIRASSSEVQSCFYNVCKGSLYAYRDTITEGYVSLDMGVRVGVVGEAKYEEGNIVGVGEIESLVFRIPTGKCRFAEDIYRWWIEKGKPNLLICSPPASGKTTLLRSLAEYMGGGRGALRTVVVDQRREFIKSDYKDKSVDILRGYSRDLGIEVALRTMSAEVILVDELSGERDVSACLSAFGAGVPIVCTVHAESAKELYTRQALSTLMYSGMFRHYVTVTRRGENFYFRIEEAECEVSAV